MVKAGDVVLVKTASVGKCALVRSLPKETTVNPQFLVFKNIVANSAFLHISFKIIFNVFWTVKKTVVQYLPFLNKL